MAELISLFDIVQTIESAGKKRVVGAVGASDSEIYTYSQLVGRGLPDVYSEFLRNWGRSSGDLVLGEDYDFSVGALIAAFSGCQRPNLLPIALNAADSGPEFLCLDWELKLGDHGLYGLWGKACARDLDGFISRQFRHWFASCVVRSQIIRRKKFRYQCTPRLTDRYFDMTRIVNVDAVVKRVLIEDCFAPIFASDGIPVYSDVGGSFLTYYRPPNLRSFAIDIGTPEYERLNSLTIRLAAALKISIDVRAV